MDQALLKSYQAIVINYAKSKNRDFDILGPFFVNGDLHRWVGKRNQRTIDYVKFCKYAKIPKFKSHSCRNMFSTFLGASTSLVLRECAGIEFRTF